MAKYKYTFQKYDKKKMVKVAGTNLPISTKASAEIARFVKNKQVDKSIVYLEEVVKLKKAVPYKRYTEVGHRKGDMTSGRYPKKAAQYIIKILKGLKKEAETKGLDVDKLVILHAISNKGPRVPRYGRQRGRIRKNTHIEFIGEEREIKQKKKGEKKQPKKRAPKKVEAPKKAEKPKQEKKEETKPQSKSKDLAAPRTGGATE